LSSQSIELYAVLAIVELNFIQQQNLNAASPKKQDLHIHKFVMKYLYFWLLAWTAFVANAEILNGTVVKISDGDTIVVLDDSKIEHKVRLMGIDAPEKSQAFGREAKQTLSNYIHKNEVTVEYKKYDKYKRIVGKVTLNGQDICLQMIRDGMALHYTEYEKEQSKTDRELYREAEASAIKKKIGFWNQEGAIKPSEFRSLQKIN
jgi:endonuclease YncB( thermonuclease family)